MEEGNSLARPAVEMIAAAIVTLSKIGQFPADPRQSRRARQFAKLAGHLTAMIAIRDCHLCFTHGDADPSNNRAAGGSNTPLCNPRPRQDLGLGLLAGFSGDVALSSWWPFCFCFQWISPRVNVPSHCQINLSQSKKPEAGRAITPSRLRSAIRSPPRLGRSAASIATQDGVEGVNRHGIRTPFWG